LPVNVLKDPHDWPVYYEYVDLSTHVYLHLFSAVRKRDGTEYEPGTLTSIQYSIDRHLKEKKVNFSIRKDERFSHSNQVLISKRKHLKAQGKGNLKSKAEPLSTDEFQQLRDKQLLGKGKFVIYYIRFK
jgi:hypothetical protein